MVKNPSSDGTRERGLPCFVRLCRSHHVPSTHEQFPNSLPHKLGESSFPAPPKRRQLVRDIKSRQLKERPNLAHNVRIHTGVWQQQACHFRREWWHQRQHVILYGRIYDTTCVVNVLRILKKQNALSPYLVSLDQDTDGREKLELSQGCHWWSLQQMRTVHSEILSYRFALCQVEGTI